MLGRVAGHARGDDHVTCAIDAIDRGPGIDGDGHHERRIERAGQESGKLEREIHRGPGGAGGSGREPGHGKAAGPKPKTPGADLGVSPPFPLPANNAIDAPRELPQPRRAPARRSRAPWRPLTRRRRRAPGGGAIRQATYAAQSFISALRRSNRSLRR